MARKWWRLQVYDNDGDTSYIGGISLIRFLSEGNAVDQTGGTAFASTEYGTSFGAEAAFDGSTSSYWSSDKFSDFPYTIGFEFQDPVDVTGVEITVAPGSRYARAPASFHIEYSDDGVNWHPLYGKLFSHTGWVSGESRTFQVALFPLAGNATTQAGNPVDDIFIFDWITGTLTKALKPDQSGNWQTTVGEGQYGLTYLAAGCQPITHGPYTLVEN